MLTGASEPSGAPVFSRTKRRSMQNAEQGKRAVGFAAVDRYVRTGMCIGLGSGTTAFWAIERVGERVHAGEEITAVATSSVTERLCRERGIPLVPFGERDIAVAIDGADEVAADWSLTKGGGGALFREKAVALAAEVFVVIVTREKLVERLGAFRTPVEVVPYAQGWVQRAIRSTFGVEAVLRGAGEPYITDNGNVLFDCAFGSIEDPAALDAQLRALHGVVDTGLFTGLTDAVLVDRDGGVEALVRP
jgi:ribose 5-phosphate isomerase A